MTPSLDEQKRRVPSKFDRVARTYDLLTGLNPGYTRHLRMSAQRLGLHDEQVRVLDLCCGTGLSTEALRQTYPRAEIVALDGSAGMLARARAKPILSGVRFVQGDAMDPRAAGVEGSFDGILMAYGIRNMPEPDLCLERIRSLLHPGAAVCFHEYSVADSRLRQAIWQAVSAGIIIPGGILTAGRSDIYRYLRRSVLAFDGVLAFEARLGSAGFVDVATLPMDGWQRGIVHSFVARRPK